MDAGAAAGLVFLAVGAAGGAGLVLRRRLPEDALDTASHDERNSQLHRIAADVVPLDRTLERYGNGARQPRDDLRSALTVSSAKAGNTPEAAPRKVSSIGFRSCEPLLARVSGRRTFGKRSALDIVDPIMLGSPLSLALTGDAPLLRTMAPAAVLVLHQPLTQDATCWPGLGRDGRVDEQGRLAGALSAEGMPVRRKRKRRNKDLAPSPIATRSGTALGR